MIGIYKITNKINKKVYIGQSHNLENRYDWTSQSALLRCCTNDHLKFSIKKYGIENFIFSVLDKIELKESNDIQNKLNELEMFYILLYKSYDKQFGYNKRMGGAFGGRPTRETKNKISNNKERSKHISESRKGKTYTDYYGDKAEEMKKFLTRNCHSEESNKKISEANKNVKKKTIECPYCGKIGGIPQMKQFHFENCMSNPSSKRRYECPHCNKTGCKSTIERHIICCRGKNEKKKDS